MRTTLKSFLAVGILLAMQVTAQAVQITDLTTNTTYFYDNFSTSSPVTSTAGPDSSGPSFYPTTTAGTIGTWAPALPDNPAIGTQVTNSTASPDPGPYGPSGSANYLREFRTLPSGANGVDASALASSIINTPNDVVEMKVEVYLPGTLDPATNTDVYARTQILLFDAAPGASNYLSAVAWMRSDGAGGVQAVTGDGSGTSPIVSLPTSLTYATNTWQEWDLKYTVGSGQFQVGINGVFDSTKFSSYLNGSGVVGVDLLNSASTPGGSVYFAWPAAVPEPSSILLMILGGLGLMALRRLNR